MENGASTSDTPCPVEDVPMSVQMQSQYLPKITKRMVWWFCSHQKDERAATRLLLSFDEFQNAPY